MSVRGSHDGACPHLSIPHPSPLPTPGLKTVVFQVAPSSSAAPAVWSKFIPALLRSAQSDTDGLVLESLDLLVDVSKPVFGGALRRSL